MDVLLPLDAPPSPIWLEIGEKYGRYDGAQRDRITLRPVPHSVLAEPIVLGTVSVSVTDTTVSIVVRQGRETLWQREYRRLRDTLDADGPARIVGWHYQRFYPHLRRSYDAEVQALIAS